MKITDEIRQRLREPLPKEAVKPHPTKNYLSTIKAIYVVERLNDVFGVGMWKLTSEVIDNSTKHIVVKSHLVIPEYEIELESYGGNDNADLGDAYKGATTDALTKMASMLEIGIDVFKGYGNNPPVKEPSTDEKVNGMLKKQQQAGYDELVPFDLKGKIKACESKKAVVKLTQDNPYWTTSEEFQFLCKERVTELEGVPA
ncbi:MAG TPA: hypothetical protein VD907_06835 [Verrucomicrobiae bacterium]|nr:hypothetical protein [Verrucomicrobiae bacterium]